jgi:hypothetical protein
MKNPHTIPLSSRLVIGWAKSPDGKWSREGKTLPWICLVKPKSPGFGGLTLIVGAVSVGIMWKSSAATEFSQ